MRISVFGLGYVGSVTSACLANDGHTVIGVDVADVKVNLINNSRAPIIETGLNALIDTAVKSGTLRATTDAAEAIAQTDIAMICVGTPSKNNGDLNTDHLQQTCTQIGSVLASRIDYFTIVIRSTVLPGTISNLVIPTLEQASGKRAGVDFGVGNNPEFLREGTAVHDYYNPAKTVIGGIDARTTDSIASLYRHLQAPLIVTDMHTAELVKYADNVWHAVKVAFANEIGVIAKSVNVDSHQVMNIFCQDTKLNLSPYYLKPGFAFGGSCLPKDLRALNYCARSRDLTLPLLSSVLPSNALHIERGIAAILATQKQRIGILGFSFKAGTDDLRESPMVQVIETLIGKGKTLQLYDHSVNLASLVGANKNYILERIPHISRLMVETIETILEQAEVVVIGNHDPAFAEILPRLKPSQQVIDLVRITDSPATPGQYHGLCW